MRRSTSQKTPVMLVLGGKLNKISLWFFVLFFCFFGIVKAGDSTLSGIDIVEYGLYRVQITKEISDTKLANGSRSVVSSPTLLRETEKIPAEIGNSFGFKYIIKDFPKGQKIRLKMVTIFPSIGLINAKTNRRHYRDE